MFLARTVRTTLESAQCVFFFFNPSPNSKSLKQSPRRIRTEVAFAEADGKSPSELQRRLGFDIDSRIVGTARMYLRVRTISTSGFEFVARGSNFCSSRTNGPREIPCGIVRYYRSSSRRLERESMRETNRARSGRGFCATGLK